MIEIDRLFVYPIKGCRGISLESCNVVSGGLEHDRRYMIIDETGRMVTRREEQRLTRITVERSAAGFVVRSELEHRAALDLPLTFEAAPEEFSVWVNSSVWRDTPRARLHDEGSQWLSALLGRNLRLVYLPEESLRQVNPARARVGDKVSFADGYPLLLTSSSSLDELNRRLPSPIGMHRFRPNVVVRGAASFAEDTWAALTLGKLPCTAPKLCDRCVVITMEEGSSEKSVEPLKTLATFRRWDGAVWFGTNVIPSDTGTLEVGNQVHIDEFRPHPHGSRVLTRR